MKSNIPITISSGNVFADIEIPYPEVYLVKAELAYIVSEWIKKQGLTQKEASYKLRTTQPRVSNLLKGRLDVFSIETLLIFLLRLNMSFEFKIQ